MASALIFLTNKSLSAKGPQTYFDATHITSKNKHFKTLQKGDVPDIKGDIIVEVTHADKVEWTPLLNALGSKYKTQIVPMITKDFKPVNTVKAIEGYPIHPIALDGFSSLGDWYAEYVAGLLKVKLKT
tara:strand:+ start:72 stop:455 length:384 start_codon:yes stop_codon:yes gene_type:complete